MATVVAVELMRNKVISSKGSVDWMVERSPIQVVRIVTNPQTSSKHCNSRCPTCPRAIAMTKEGMSTKAGNQVGWTGAMSNVAPSILPHTRSRAVEDWWARRHSHAMSNTHPYPQNDHAGNKRGPIAENRKRQPFEDGKDERAGSHPGDQVA